MPMEAWQANTNQPKGHDMSYRETENRRPSARARRAETRAERRAVRVALATYTDADDLEV